MTSWIIYVACLLLAAYTKASHEGSNSKIRHKSSVIKWVHNNDRSRNAQNIFDAVDLKRKNIRTKNAKAANSSQAIVNHLKKEKTNKNIHSKPSVTSYHKERLNAFDNSSKRQEGSQHLKP